MNSALYVGHVRHRRFSPVQHSFDYRIFMPLIDLDELALLPAQGIALERFPLRRFIVAIIWEVAISSIKPRNVLPN